MLKYLSWTVCVCAFTTTLAAGVVEAPSRLEHFQCYPVRRAAPDVEDGVGLTDQFSTNQQKVRVRGATWFCNPTRKLHNGQAFGVRDIRQHLTFYWTLTEEPEPVRVVKIRNQFGEQTLQVRESIFLAVPTQKLVHDPPERLDHFKCYRATGRRVRRPSVGLSDQFILPITRHRVRRPVAFCNPTEKQHTDFITPINNALSKSGISLCYLSVHRNGWLYTILVEDFQNSIDPDSVTIISERKMTKIRIGHTHATWYRESFICLS